MLGLLFFVYINDLCLISALFEFVLFAEDTNLFTSGDNLSYNLSSQYEDVNNEMNLLSQ